MQLRVRYTASSGGEDVQGQYSSTEFEFEDVDRDDVSIIVYILNTIEPRIMTLREVEGSIESSEAKRERRQEMARLVKLHVETHGKTVSEVSDDLLITEESVRQLLKEANNG